MKPGSPFLSVRLVLIITLLPMLGLLMFPAGTPTAADAPVGDPPRGATLFQPCAACHSTEPGMHLTGPSLAAIWNRRAAWA